MSRKYRPTKVFVTTSVGYKTYLSSQKDVVEATRPYMTILQKAGYKNIVASEKQNVVSYLMVNGNDSAMISAFRLY